MSSPIKNVSEKHHLQKRGESGSSITSSKKYKKFAEKQKKRTENFVIHLVKKKFAKPGKRKKLDIF
jgi:hypothetical protein